MTECIFCNTVEGKTKLERVYEDKDLIAVVHPRGAVAGHVLVFPKKHYQIFEQIPDYEVKHLFKNLQYLVFYDAKIILHSTD